MNDSEMKRLLADADPLCAEHDSIVDQLEQVTTDRDIKAANLKTLVDMVLGYADTCEQCARSGNDGGDIADANDAWKELIALARGLKQ
jgi:hypothetical protein